MRSTIPLALCGLCLGLAGCSICCKVEKCCVQPNPANRIGIALPDAVHTAVLQVMPGFVAREIELESKGDTSVYELEGTWNGSTYEIEVDAQGNVLRIDQEIEDEAGAEHEGDDDKPGDDDEPGDDGAARDAD